MYAYKAKLIFVHACIINYYYYNSTKELSRPYKKKGLGSRGNAGKKTLLTNLGTSWVQNREFLRLRQGFCMTFRNE